MADYAKREDEAEAELLREMNEMLSKLDIEHHCARPQHFCIS